MLETHGCLGTSDEFNLRFGSDSYAKGAWGTQKPGNASRQPCLLWPLVAVKFIEYAMAHNSTLYALKTRQHCWSALRQDKETENKQI